MRKIYITLITAIFFGGLSISQDNSRFNINFFDDDFQFQNALTGGFESPQFYEIDLNLDGLKDLLVFDRKGGAFRTFIYNPEIDFPYIYSPQFEEIFPKVQCWLNVKDFNNDGIDDLFTCGVTDPVTGIEVWKGIEVDGVLTFQPYHHPGGPYNIIYYEHDGDYKQLYVGNNGIPGIADIDEDGDIDVLAFQPSGGYLYYFQNQAVERGLALDSLVFIRADDCWGNFYEGGLVPDIILSNDNESCAIPSGSASASPRHEGITLTVIDKNHDGLKDLLIGEVSSSNMIYVENGGTVENAFATYKEIDFPSEDVPVQMQIFLASFLIDAERDGREDIIISPNSQFGTNTNNAHYYENIEMNGEPLYQLVQDDWLVEHSLDFGTDSYPAFFDYNGDGLQDILVGSYGLVGLEEGPETRLYLFENTGTIDIPEYNLVDRDYLDFTQYSSFDKSYIPGFGDLDSDGDIDMVLGTLSGEIVFIENLAGAGNPVQFSQPIFDYFELNAENNTIRASIGDVNNDGLSDIIIGGRNSYSLDEGIGSLKAFLNSGSSGNPIFNDDNVIRGLGGINMKESGSSKVSGAPKFLNADDQKLILIGNEIGRIAVYRVTEDNNYELIDEDLLGDRLGRRVGIDLADIDNDGYLEMAIGNERGGLNIWNTVIQSSGNISNIAEFDEISHSISLFPNPSTSFLSVKGIDNGTYNYSISNIIGNQISSGKSTGNRINVSYIPCGVYFITLYTERPITLKFIKA